jgi:hypothetical protein
VAEDVSQAAQHIPCSGASPVETAEHSSINASSVELEDEVVSGGHDAASDDGDDGVGEEDENWGEWD